MHMISRQTIWKRTLLLPIGAALFLFPQPPAVADTEFQVKKMTRTDVPLGKGQCDIRLRVDGEVEVSMRGDRVHVRTINGRDSRDDGSECNEPLPAREVSDFGFEIHDGRGEIKLLSEPSRRTGFNAVVRIRDSEGGDGRYHFRISWQMDGGGVLRDRGPEGGWPGNRPGGPPPYGNRFTQAQAVNICSDSARDRISRDFRYNNVEIQNARVDERQGRDEWIIGDARARNGYAVELFIFSCQVDYNSGRVRAVDARIR